MNKWQKNITICLVVILAANIIATFSPIISAATTDPKYAGIKSINESLEIKFSENNNSILYADNDYNINFSVGFGRYTFDYMSLGAFIYSVSYKASWQNNPVTVYNWSYHDPANLKDDDPNQRQSWQDTINIKEASLGNQKITITAFAGSYVTDFKSYWLYTVNSSLTLNFTIASPPPVTPSPTFSKESGILWKTNLTLNLTGTPAQNVWPSNIDGKGRTWTNPVIADNKVYATSTSSVRLNYYGRPEIKWINVYAFNELTGAIIWDYQDNFYRVTNPAIENGIVYFGAKGGGYTDMLNNRVPIDSMNALDSSNGNLLWTTPCDVGFFSSPAVSAGKVVIGSGHSVIALDATKGNIIWNFTTGAGVLSSPTIVNGVVYIGSYDSNMYALDARNGNNIWNFTAEQGFFYPPTISNGVVYCSSQDGNVYALNAATGIKIWNFDTSPPKIITSKQTDQTFDPTTPVVKDGVVYVTSSGLPYDPSIEDYGRGYSTVYALDCISGRKVWNNTINFWGAGSPTLADGVVYANIWPYTIYGFQASNGARVWNYSNVQTDPVVVKGVIYLGIGDQLYAIKTPTYGQTELFAKDNAFSDLTVILVAIVLIAVALLVLSLWKKRSHFSNA
jgi:outer membrane protein assembly factor BamB